MYGFFLRMPLRIEKKTSLAAKAEPRRHFYGTAEAVPFRKKWLRLGR